MKPGKYREYAHELETYLLKKYHKKGKQNYHFKVRNIRKDFPTYGYSLLGRSITICLVPKGTVIKTGTGRSHGYTYKTNFKEKK